MGANHWDLYGFPSSSLLMHHAAFLYSFCLCAFSIKCSLQGLCQLWLTEPHSQPKDGDLKEYRLHADHGPLFESHCSKRHILMLKSEHLFFALFLPRFRGRSQTLHLGVWQFSHWSHDTPALVSATPSGIQPRKTWFHNSFLVWKCPVISAVLLLKV